ncbi:bifunctional diguanylate cyclase/phosphodiesterase [Aureimonas endophytica]|uniref:Bifunctional diguanylate cyclase/phosphodiesterase n=1 Tax=Aureimonas endophytica TaxID=2027858 RepID=A0A917E7L4_9HYPH|nr:EAL domain-containing protein [Aureimonas endophytica]GGE08353.1 bifunctional diguanylate cyclase/phosphodiesterase [Aureimonas endophytica]
METLFTLAVAHSPSFVAGAAVICLTTGWFLASLLTQMEEAWPRRQPYRLVATAMVAGLGVWTTHFVAMLGYRPDVAVEYDPAITFASATIAVLAVGLPLAVSATVSRAGARLVLAGLAGLGIGAMHATGMAALSGCLRTQSLTASLAGCVVGAAFMMLARGLPPRHRSRPVACLLITCAVCGAHFTAISGTTLQSLAGAHRSIPEDLILGLLIAASPGFLFVNTLLSLVALKRFETQEREHAGVLSLALENMSHGLAVFDGSGRLELFNDRYRELCRLGEDRLRAGMSLDALLDAIGAACGWDAAWRARVEAAILARLAAKSVQVADWTAFDGRIILFETRPLRGGGIAYLIDDVTADRQARRQMQQLTLIDPLTGLANRAALQAELEAVVASGAPQALILIDLDRFQNVNNMFGHAVGDQLLIEVAARLRAAAGDDVFIARLGADEMAVLARGAPDECRVFATALAGALSWPFAIGETSFALGCGIGLCHVTEAPGAAELMQRAELALYEAKRKVGDRISAYEPQLQERITARHHLEKDLDRAIERGEFHLAYQPVLSLEDERIIGYEALIRWDHPTRGPVSPAEFVPMAEETGQIVPIGRWVLREACREAATWPDQRHVAVNVSPVQFRSPLLLADITAALAASGLPAQRLEVELTETAMVEDGKAISHALENLRSLGIRVAMDDFGTGYSSLVHIRDFPLDRIKIDRSFVSRALDDPHSLAVLKAITQMGRDMAIATLAEGVETPEQMRMLRDLGCGAVQGYLIGRPERFGATALRGGTYLPAADKTREADERRSA